MLRVMHEIFYQHLLDESDSYWICLDAVVWIEIDATGMWSPMIDAPSRTMNMV